VFFCAFMGVFLCVQAVFVLDITCVFICVLYARHIRSKPCVLPVLTPSSSFGATGIPITPSLAPKAGGVPPKPSWQCRGAGGLPPCRQASTHIYRGRQPRTDHAQLVLAACAHG